MNRKNISKETGFGKKIADLLVYIWAAVCLFPVFMIINYSFKTKREIYIGNPISIPQKLNFDNYKNAFEKLNIGVMFANTVFYTICSVLILVILCSAAAWAIQRNKKRFFRFSYYYFIVGILIPAQALFLPIYVVGYKLNLVDTRIGVILMFVATNLSFGVFLMTGFITTVPVELEEAARIDGYSLYQIFFRIVLPLLKPAIATLIILQSFQIWNEYLMSSLFVSSNDLKTITVAIQGLFSQQTSDYTTAFAAIIISVTPIAVLFMFLQKYFIKGLTVGAVKG